MLDTDSKIEHPYPWDTPTQHGVAAENNEGFSLAAHACMPADGPPFATGLPHYGHLLAGTIKVSRGGGRRAWRWQEA